MPKRKAPTDQLTVREFKRRGWRTVGKTEYWQATMYLIQPVLDAAVAFLTWPGLNETATLFEATLRFTQGQPGRRKDLFGFADYVVATGKGIRFIQVTADSGISARVKKIRSECKEAAIDVLTSHGSIEVWGWKQEAPRKPWTLRRVGIILVEGTLLTEKLADPKPAAKVVRDETRMLFD